METGTRPEEEPDPTRSSGFLASVLRGKLDTERANAHKKVSRGNCGLFTVTPPKGYSKEKPGVPLPVTSWELSAQ